MSEPHHTLMMHTRAGQRWLRVSFTLEVDGTPGEYSCEFGAHANESADECLARHADDFERRKRQAPGRIRALRKLEQS